MNMLHCTLCFQVKQMLTPPTVLEDRGKVAPPGRPPGPYQHKVTSLDSKEPKKAWTEDSHISDE